DRGHRTAGVARRPADGPPPSRGRARLALSGRCGYLPRGMTTGAEDTASLLGSIPVFEELSRGDLEQVAAVAVPRRFASGHVVFREGDDSDTCYVVRAGHARALREHPDGRQITLATFGPGDIFGELAMFDNERRSATVEATDELEALAILGPDMRA